MDPKDIFPESFLCIESAKNSIHKEVVTTVSMFQSLGTREFFDFLHRKNQVILLDEIKKFMHDWIDTSTEESFLFANPIMIGSIKRKLSDKVYSYSSLLVGDDDQDSLVLLATIKACVSCVTFVETVLMDAVNTDIGNLSTLKNLTNNEG